MSSSSRPICKPQHFAERGNFTCAQLTPLPDSKALQRERAQPDPHQLQYFASDRFQHAPHLTIAAFRDRQLQVRVFLRISNSFNYRWPGAAVVQFDASGEALDIFLR